MKRKPRLQIAGLIGAAAIALVGCTADRSPRAVVEPSWSHHQIGQKAYEPEPGSAHPMQVRQLRPLRESPPRLTAPDYEATANGNRQDQPLLR